ncbi:stability determinant [Serratia sp. 14-2641]|uniref:type II toxin-antitoxin system RelB family antitoxin n=1 Tax=Serratia sp. 14-2641 TaxID=1841657 RepID=UPI00080FCE52|nr:stability determinant [Serratia sp. 14-2641]OCJ36809.1 stability determinant [Serratia sp. 14-2641]
MSALLSPIVSEFETQEQADSYDRWFRAKVQEALDDPRPGIPHDEVMAEMEVIIAEAESRMRKSL